MRLLVTVDAMHTHTATAKLICSTLKSHYLMVVKANQAGLLARITALPWAEVPVTATDDSRGHGRVETRTLQTLTAARGIGFPYARQVVRITRERLVTATGATHRRGRLRDLQPAVRAGPTHHDRAPGCASTGASRIRRTGCAMSPSTRTDPPSRTGTAPQVMASLRNTAINLHRIAGADNIAEACRVTPSAPSLDPPNPCV